MFDGFNFIHHVLCASSISSLEPSKVILDISSQWFASLEWYYHVSLCEIFPSAIFFFSSEWVFVVVVLLKNENLFLAFPYSSLKPSKELLLLLLILNKSHFFFREIKLTICKTFPFYQVSWLNQLWHTNSIQSHISKLNCQQRDTYF